MDGVKGGEMKGKVEMLSDFHSRPLNEETVGLSFFRSRNPNTLDLQSLH